MAQLWQHPYVNVFKHFDIQSWKKASKEGEVTSQMDRTLKGTVYKISGSIPAGNYLQLPKTGSQSLGLTGRYMYLLFKPIPSKYFVVHIDIATQDGLIVRISFSNLFKEFKSTSTWLQFPFVCNASKGSVCAQTGMISKDQQGPAPMSTRWTVLCLDLQHILSTYLNRRYSYLKSVKLCANMLVKNIFTSDMEYEPGLTFDQVKKTGMTLHGVAPMPRELAFPLMRTQTWHQHYDLINFPTDTSKKPFDSVQYTKTGTNPNLSKTGDISKSNLTRVEPKTVSVSRAVTDRTALIDKITSSKSLPRRHKVTSQLPPVGVTEQGDVSIEQTAEGEVHVHAFSSEPIIVHQKAGSSGRTVTTKVKAPAQFSMNKDSYSALQPDPILQMRRIVGFGGCRFQDALWTSNGTDIVYPCHAVVVSMQVNNGHQRFFIGHTDKVACVSMNQMSTLLVSGQTGPQSVVRVWRYQTAECLAMFKTHTHSLHCLSMSSSGSVVCGVGKDGHGKNMVVIWNTEQVSKGGQVSVMAKAHTEVDIVKMRIAAFDDTRMVSCGRDNIRLWRVKDGSLRSAPVNLGEYHTMEFSDCCFEAGYEATRDPLDRLVYACTKSGHIFELDYRKVAIHHVRRLLPVDNSANKEKQTFNSGSGLSINTMCVNEAFCVTGSDDGYLRLWPLDFKHVYLEAEHEGPVTAVDISADGIKILAGTSTGNLGILDVSTRGYTTIMRSHTGRITSMSLDPLRRHMATTSDDHTTRVWDLDTMQQLYDFSAPKECPCAISYHPRHQVFAVGFESGAVRIFNVSSTSLLAEHKQHRGKVVGLVFSTTGDYLYSAGSLGALALYDTSENQYQLLRLLGNTVARGENHGPDSLSVSPDGRHVAFVGPTDFTVTVVDGRSLDEVMRIDISNLSPGDSNRATVDSAMRVKFAPASVKQLLVTTASNKLLKFDARNGKLLAEIANIHRSGCSAIDVSNDGRHLVTAGDRVVKIWDYHMRLDLNFQVFIGHSESISRTMFTPDSLSFISVGEAIFIWDFLANAHDVPPPQPEGRTPVKNYFTGKEEELVFYKSPKAPKGILLDRHSDVPRQSVPQPVDMYEPGGAVADISDINYSAHNGDLLGEDVMSELSERVEEVLVGPELHDHYQRTNHLQNEVSERLNGSLVQPQPYHQPKSLTPEKKPVTPTGTPNRGRSSHPSSPGKTSHSCPTVLKHFKRRQKAHTLAQRRYTAPPNQAGLKLQSVIGYNGNGRGNMVWNADTGVFAYTQGSILMLEGLSEGTQQHLLGHNEEISTLALQHDSLLLASASGSSSVGLVHSQLCIWDIQQAVCKRTLTHHDHDIVCLAFSRDDRFLISVGDYRDCSVVVWNTLNYSLVSSTKTSVPMHEIKWDPYTVNEFASIGEGGIVLFWLLDETSASCSLNVHEAKVPDDLLQVHHLGGSSVDFTCMEYGGDSILYICTSHGHISAWDTRHNTCFMHWEADQKEIDIVCSKGGRLVTGSASNSLKMWSVAGINELKGPGDQQALRGGITMEDEMSLDGAIVSASFDDTMDMGIVGTDEGTLWCINWAERSSIRLVSGHNKKINCVSLCNDKFMATCADDGSLRVWSLADREQTLKFQVLDQSCNCLAFAPTGPVGMMTSTKVSTTSGMLVTHNQPDEKSQLPNIVGGYSDGTVRMFDLAKMEMVLKMHPHAVAVTAITFSADGRMILSGGCDGLVAISSPTTGMTVRVINDHKGAPISTFDVTFVQDQDLEVSAPMLWLAASADRRVSVWSADWSKDYCELIDWMTFPAPAFTPEGTVIKKGDQSYFQHVPPTLAMFSHEEPDVIVYCGYGMAKQIQFYSLANKKVLRTVALTHWATSLHLCPSSPLMAVGSNEWLLKLMDYYEGSFQDYVGHNNSLMHTRFSPDGRILITVSGSEILVWKVMV